MKYCPNCGNEISDNNGMCTKCGLLFGQKASNKINKKKNKWIVPIILVFGFILFISMGDKIDENTIIEENDKNSVNQNQQEIEYIKISKDDLDQALDSNAAAAKDKYNNKYVEVSGRLGTIDSDLRYISLLSVTDEWDFLGIHCYIKTKEQKEIVKTLLTDQELIIRGKITDVGEVFGYYLDITEIIVD